ncbi:MAG: 4a-hydroxytetrahydrobiopterin dehydratase [Bacteroidota bacterium]|nr:4a-hydroxytetrahydrobiopterin dehydratase [Bacteroidota bacterium]MDP4234579.1 4a-hydroxytetrahydrobiopterin dehydratase [Bacteroidota bacterium]MDP4243708.1 4a-hydroxytetrahydrobiopterin dehydratase [Bacteroidota bacterium]MDP4288344.1 4a-hydroxytetrahydrobiopterin dehydratase [Bacteroidota bacterium]
MPLTPKDRLSTEQITAKLTPLTGWSYNSAKPQIEKNFERKDFVDSTSFIQEIAEIAERHDHHPDLLLHDYKYVQVMLSTHSAGGITQSDFDVAQEIDRIPS